MLLQGFTDSAWIFFSNQIGQIITILLAFIAGVKYLEHRQAKMVDDKVDDKLTPFKNDMMHEMTKIKGAFETLRVNVDTTLRFVEKSIDRMQNNTRRRDRDGNINRERDADRDR